MSNLSSYCGLVDAKIRASDKDLPVPNIEFEASPDTYSTTDHWIQSINRFSIQACFVKSGLQREKKIQTAISMLLLRSVF